MTRAELVALVAHVMSGLGGEEEQDADLRRIEAAVLHPRVAELMFWGARELTAEQVVDEALAYEPIAL